MVVTTIYQRTSKLPGVCIRDSSLGLISWRRVPYLNLTPVTFRVPHRRAPLSCTHLPHLSRLPRHIPRHNLLSTYLRIVFFPWTPRLSYTFVLRVNRHLNILDSLKAPTESSAAMNNQENIHPRLPRTPHLHTTNTQLPWS